MTFEIPAACTLPSAERPLRLKEFDELLAASAFGAERTAPTALALRLRGGDDLETVVRDLTAREASCCSFFDFDITVRGAEVLLEIGVPTQHAAILDSLHAKVASVA